MQASLFTVLRKRHAFILILSLIACFCIVSVKQNGMKYVQTETNARRSNEESQHTKEFGRIKINLFHKLVLAVTY